MGQINLRANGTRAEEWNDTTRTYTAWDSQGAQTSTRPYTAAENAAADAQAAQNTAMTNGVDLRTKATTALAANATFLGVASPTNAQVVTQVQRLTRENNALIRLALNLLDDVSGT